MKKKTLSIQIRVVVEVVMIVYLLTVASCSNYGVNKHLKEDGHWPGWIVGPEAPLYGPHDRQVELRNAYSDGWQDRGGAIKHESKH